MNLRPGASGQIAVGFLCGGGSALLLSVVSLQPQYWFLSFIALIPFLRCVARCRQTQILVAGAALGSAYTFIVSGQNLWSDPATFAAELLLLNFLLGAYGLLVNWLHRRIGFNVIFVAALWLPVEYVRSHVGQSGAVMPVWELAPVLAPRLASLLGLMVVAFAILVINSLFYLALERTVEVLLHRTEHESMRSGWQFILCKEILIEPRWYCFPDRRAPPGRLSRDAERIEDGTLSARPRHTRRY